MNITHVNAPGLEGTIVIDFNDKNEELITQEMLDEAKANIHEGHPLLNMPTYGK